MSDTFLPADPVSSKEQIVEQLYNRLSDIRLRLEHAPGDEFEEGLDYAMTIEREWLEDLLDIIERS